MPACHAPGRTLLFVSRSSEQPQIGTNDCQRPPENAQLSGTAPAAATGSIRGAAVQDLTSCIGTANGIDTVSWPPGGERGRDARRRPTGPQWIMSDCWHVRRQRWRSGCIIAAWRARMATSWTTSRSRPAFGSRPWPRSSTRPPSGTSTISALPRAGGAGRSVRVAPRCRTGWRGGWVTPARAGHRHRRVLDRAGRW